jgi:hypothetical protein
MTTNLLRSGGILASILVIAFGAGSVATGAWGIDTVRDELRQEQIVGTPDSTIPGRLVDTGSEARAFADVMRKHTLEATGGKTYAQMDRFIAADGGTTSDEAKAKVVDGRPVDNEARNIWVTETALATALTSAYMAEQIAVFAIVVGVALLLIGVGLLVVALRVLPRARPAIAPRPVTA